MSVAPIVTIHSITLNTISDENGFTQSVCTFFSNKDISKWEARAVLGDSNPPRGVGQIVESGGFAKAGEEISIYVDFNELTLGDGLYTVSIYVQDIFGNWSDGTFENAYIGTIYNRRDCFNSGFKYNCSKTRFVSLKIKKDKYNTKKTFNGRIKFNSSKE